jgi:Ni/Co efflux regulator RcnB
MKSTIPTIKYALALAMAGVLVAGPVMADKPSWAGKGGKEDRGERRDDDRDARHGDEGRSKHFDDHRRAAVRDFYVVEHRGGRCPPGLAKKHNGCMPPGQARKWEYGRPLPREVVVYDVPPPLVVKIGAPPSGYRYARVASDILMVAIGTGMVVDAIKDLGR